ncbi:MAG: copper resistance protein NlpE [Alcanivorax sp.]|nr:copper resistance protein NlpE [Alcanivorax sp.]
MNTGNGKAIRTTDLRDTWPPPRLLPCLLLLAFLGGCAATPSPDTASDGSDSPAAAPTATPTHHKTYQGILPCPDCEGLQVTLILDNAAYTYRATERRLGAQDTSEPEQSSGPWARRRGTEADPDAIIYQLDHDRPGSTRNFLRLDAARIKLLDEFKREFWSPFNLILERTD